jgi:hypothetical protein
MREMTGKCLYGIWPCLKSMKAGWIRIELKTVVAEAVVEPKKSLV